MTKITKIEADFKNLILYKLLLINHLSIDCFVVIFPETYGVLWHIEI